MSNKVEVDESRFEELKDQVVVLTGGANGIGASTVRYLTNAGAFVVFGDYDQAAGKALVESFTSVSNAPIFVPMDVSKYSDNITLFKTAFEKYSRIDHAVANAGILERGAWFDPGLTLESVETPDTDQVIHINLLGTLYFTRIALVYLRQNRTPGDDKSITLISSAAGFRDSPGLYTYQCSKHGILGLLRTTRLLFHDRENVRINAICPGIVDSQMTTSIIDSFCATGQAINTPAHVARHIVNLQVAGPEMWGKGIYVEGGRGWEFLSGIDATMETWLGEEPAERLKVHLQHVKHGAGWQIK
ncbi:hypothetical protein LTR95_016951 [Oleoguttula sp. CCFEE 5521]